MIEDGQRQGLQQHALGERAVHRQHRGAGKVQLTLGVAVDVAGEPVIGQIRQGVRVQEVREHRERGVVEGELRQHFQEPARAGDDAVSPTVGEPAREDLERGPSVGGAVAKCGRQHRQLVLVGEQSRRRMHLIGSHSANRSRSDRRRGRCLSWAAWLRRREPSQGLARNAWWIRRRTSRKPPTVRG